MLGAIIGDIVGSVYEFESDKTKDFEFFTEEIRPIYEFDVTCQGSVPQAIQCFLESTDFEDAIRNAVSLGGDNDVF